MNFCAFLILKKNDKQDYYDLCVRCLILYEG
jgi:hypothetical protein